MRVLVAALVIVALAVPAHAHAQGEEGEGETPATQTTARPAAEAVRRAQLEKELVEVRNEEAATTRLWPILTLVVGAAAVATAATSGAIAAIDCHGSCSSGAWQGVTVMAGAAVATFGVLWLRWTNADLDELNSRRYRLERDQIAAGAGTTAALTPQARTLMLGVRTRF